MQQFIEQMPKVELHLHIEGTLEPELMFELAKRNQVSIPFSSAEEVKQAYQFHNLQSFLDIYYQGANVLIQEQDFFDLTWAYIEHCQQDNVRHCEIFFDPQTHTARGIEFGTVVNGIHKALVKAKDEYGISSQLIMCFLRHLDENSAFETLTQALPHKDKIIGVGLDSSELGHPPEKFERVFQQAIKEGFLTVAHAGEEGPSSNIQDAMSLLGVSRVDHGVRCVDDPKLIETLQVLQVPLTVCPLSNIKLKVFETMEEHNVVELLRQGLCVTINSDDPSYFGGYMTENFLQVAMAHPIEADELAQFTRNAIKASFIDEYQKQVLMKEINHYVDAFKRK
ncbi:adenine deaminase [Vibrio halioticoli NBRC 102217]|uniref:Adenine deaminase n=1 Tax=Vibrio halioticoli NBRC 102217 TaxID=1219072 RepID=V5FLQ5_9VIBR|nr:adenosine deaminase [Vibrio halioticoli]GAD89802.1 adenine deaminase [Vibrio halioticoli NBRC 102217]